jgi:hypothetical protein
MTYFAVESGRWQNVDRNMRICNLCDRKEIVDEFHYILEFNNFNNILKKYIDDHDKKRPNIIKVGELITIKNQIKLTNFANSSS